MKQLCKKPDFLIKCVAFRSGKDPGLKFYTFVTEKSKKSAHPNARCVTLGNQGSKMPLRGIE